MTTPLVTYVIPSYNHARYIAQTINSVLQQTYKNIELIVIDDGSTDESPAIIAALASQHGFIFEQQQNLGLSRTLNKAIAMARGKYFCMLGSDDVALHDKTEKQVRLMEQRDDIGVSGGNALTIDSDGVIVSKQKLHPYRELSFEDVFQFKPGIAASSAMLRMDALQKLGGYDPQIRLEDMYMWFKLTAANYKMVGLNDVLIYYRKHATNTYKNHEFMYDSMMQTFAPYAAHPLYQDVVNRYRNSMLIAIAKQGNAKKAAAILAQIPPRYWNGKTLRGAAYLVRARFYKR